MPGFYNDPSINMGMDWMQPQALSPQEEELLKWMQSQRGPAQAQSPQMPEPPSPMARGMQPPMPSSGFGLGQPSGLQAQGDPQSVFPPSGGPLLLPPNENQLSPQEQQRLHAKLMAQRQALQQQITNSNANAAGWKRYNTARDQSRSRTLGYTGEPTGGYVQGQMPGMDPQGPQIDRQAVQAAMQKKALEDYMTQNPGMSRFLGAGSAPAQPRISPEQKLKQSLAALSGNPNYQPGRRPSNRGDNPGYDYNGLMVSRDDKGGIALRGVMSPTSKAHAREKYAQTVKNRSQDMKAYNADRKDRIKGFQDGKKQEAKERANTPMGAAQLAYQQSQGLPEPMRRQMAIGAMASKMEEQVQEQKFKQEMASRQPTDQQQFATYYKAILDASGGNISPEEAQKAALAAVAASRPAGAGAGQATPKMTHREALKASRQPKNNNPFIGGSTPGSSEPHYPLPKPKPPNNPYDDEFSKWLRQAFGIE